MQGPRYIPQSLTTELISLVVFASALSYQFHTPSVYNSYQYPAVSKEIISAIFYIRNIPIHIWQTCKHIKRFGSACAFGIVITVYISFFNILDRSFSLFATWRKAMKRP